MQRSYLVKSSVNFADFGFFVKVGDILVHDPANGNKLTVYRNGAVVRDIKQTSIGLAAFVKNEVIVEVVPTVPTPTAASKTQAKPIVESKPVKKPETKAAPAPGVPISKPEFDKLKESAKKPAPAPKPKPEPKPEIEDETI
jgi:hypothetical protein